MALPAARLPLESEAQSRAAGQIARTRAGEAWWEVHPHQPLISFVIPRSGDEGPAAERSRTRRLGTMSGGRICGSASVSWCSSRSERKDIAHGVSRGSKHKKNKAREAGERISAVAHHAFHMLASTGVSLPSFR